MKRIITFITIMTLLLSGCGSKSGSEIISINGSTSVESFFNETLAPALKNDLGFDIEYQATGSSTGIQAVLDGSTTFGTSSRNLDENEADMLDQLILAYDGIALVTNKSNPVSEVTSEEARAIFTGEITNWSELGGNDQEIVVISREAASGTRGAIEEILGFENQVVEDAIIADGNGNVASTVAENPNAIGYVSFTTLNDNNEELNGLNVDSAAPTALNVLKGIYPISRPFILVYQADQLTENDQAFLQWIETTGRSLAPDAGLVEYTN